jgi:hypothetical protein
MIISTNLAESSPSGQSGDGPAPRLIAVNHVDAYLQHPGIFGDSLNTLAIFKTIGA